MVPSFMERELAPEPRVILLPGVNGACEVVEGVFVGLRMAGGKGSRWKKEKKLEKKKKERKCNGRCALSSPPSSFQSQSSSFFPEPILLNPITPALFIKALPSLNHEAVMAPIHFSK